MIGLDLLCVLHLVHEFLFELTVWTTSRSLCNEVVYRCVKDKHPRASRMDRGLALFRHSILSFRRSGHCVQRRNRFLSLPLSFLSFLSSDSSVMTGIDVTGAGCGAEVAGVPPELGAGVATAGAGVAAPGHPQSEKTDVKTKLQNAGSIKPVSPAICRSLHVTAG